MRDHKPAAVSAILFALLVGLPVSSAAIWQTAAARDALLARRALESSVAAASGSLRTSAIKADTETFAHLMRQAEARRHADPVTAHVLARAVRVTEQTVPFAELEVTLDRGENWQTLADRWGLSGTQLAALNPELDLNALQAGATVRVYRYDPAAPSISRGHPSRGRLINGVPMPDGDHWKVRNTRLAWGTSESVSSLVRGLTYVGESLPGGGQPLIADLSGMRGGRLRPHRSHTSGRDVDGTYYQVDATRTEKWERVRPSTLDVARQWALFRYWIERDEVTYIFVDRRLHQALHDHAVALGEPDELIARAFAAGPSSGIIRHVAGHTDHFHARFRCAAHDTYCREV